MHVIEFDTEGKAECLHTDCLPLESLGKLSMTRASTIEWNARKQKWEVIIGKRVRFSHASRDRCLGWERGLFNLKILNR